MSSLAERLTRARAEAAEREQAAYQEAQRKSQEAEATRLQAQTIATQQKETERALLIAELSPLLEVVGAKEQLEEVRKVWGVGIVDTQPYLKYNRLHLGIRFRFADLEIISGNRGEDLHVYHHASILCETEASITISVGQQLDAARDSSVGSSYDLTAVKKTHYGNPIHDSTLWGYRGRGLSTAEPEPFPINDPGKARKILEDQIFKITFRSVPPLELKREGRERITKDPYLRSSLPWYKRLLT